MPKLTLKKIKIKNNSKNNSKTNSKTILKKKLLKCQRKNTLLQLK